MEILLLSSISCTLRGSLCLFVKSIVMPLAIVFPPEKALHFNIDIFESSTIRVSYLQTPTQRDRSGSGRTLRHQLLFPIKALLGKSELLIMT